MRLALMMSAVLFATACDEGRPPPDVGASVDLDDVTVDLVSDVDLYWLPSADDLLGDDERYGDELAYTDLYVSPYAFAFDGDVELRDLEGDADVDLSVWTLDLERIGHLDVGVMFADAYFDPPGC